jgi:hypothetical protein
MGKIELDHTGAGGGVTLSSDGTDLLLDGAAIGGGGAALELYAENPVTPVAPSATGTNAVAIGSESVSVGTRSIALGDSYASGTDSFAAAIDNNTSSYGATGANSVAMGESAKATGDRAVAIGDRSLSTGIVSTALAPRAEATGTGAVALGYNSLASGDYSTAIGFFGQALQRSKVVTAGGGFAARGDAQAGLFVLRTVTTNSVTAFVMTTNAGTAGTTNQIILPNNSAYAFHGTIVARQQASAGTACAAWKVEGLIRREGSAGTTVLVNSATTVLDNTPAWGMALSADTTNGGLAITATGPSGYFVRWVATINTSEVTY